MNLEKRYDAVKAKHFIEGVHFVLHCHHYNSQLHRAIVATPFIDGAAFIYKVSRDDFYETMGVILAKKGITGAANIIQASNEFYKMLGFGSIDFSGLREKGGRVTAPFSHLATGYKNKWGLQDKPVDDFARGFIAAVWALAYGGKPGRCRVTQTKCISCGDAAGEFTVEV